LEITSKEAVVALFEVLHQHLSGGPEDENENPKSGLQISWQRVEYGTSPT
jgi:hypothetical protein